MTESESSGAKLVRAAWKTKSEEVRERRERRRRRRRDIFGVYLR